MRSAPQSACIHSTTHSLSAHVDEVRPRGYLRTPPEEVFGEDSVPAAVCFLHHAEPRLTRSPHHVGAPGVPGQAPPGSGRLHCSQQQQVPRTSGRRGFYIPPRVENKVEHGLRPWRDYHPSSFQWRFNIVMQSLISLQNVSTMRRGSRSPRKRRGGASSP